MAYNLIEEAWIPIRRSSGRVERIAPWQIAEAADPPLRIESPRPDFDAALLEFLIGLVQTVFTPKDSTEWEEIYEAGCSPEALREKMLTERDAFYLDGDGPRFMQDKSVVDDPDFDEMQDLVSLADLFVDREKGDKKLNEEPKMFCKAIGPLVMNRPSSAMGLIALQYFAPGGGAGNAASSRGISPMSVTVEPRGGRASLFRTVWANQLTASSLELIGAGRGNERRGPFAWMESRTSHERVEDVDPSECDPRIVWWSMPRRVWIEFEPASGRLCDVTREPDSVVGVRVRKRPYGLRFGGLRHPLSGYMKTKDGRLAPWPTPPEGLSFRDWPQAVYSSEKTSAPMVIDLIARDERDRSLRPGNSSDDYGVRIFGVRRPEQMKTTCAAGVSWPLLHGPIDSRDAVAQFARQLTHAAELVHRRIKKALERAWTTESLQGKEARIPGDLNARIVPMMDSLTVTVFFGLVRRREIQAQDLSLPDVDSLRREWVQTLLSAAQIVFDDLAPMCLDEATRDLGRVVRERRDLVRSIQTANGELARGLGLPSRGGPGARVGRSPKRKEPTP